MTNNNTSIIILAAGKGSRMKSKTAKVLHKISDEPMLFHIISEAKKISDDIHVVVSHQKEEVIKFINTKFNHITFHEQNLDKYPGTGGALKNITTKNQKNLILNGDMPLITADNLQKFLDIDSDIVMSALLLENPNGYGRIIMDGNEVLKIVEQKDATEEELLIQTVNAGVYMFKQNILNKFIPLINNNNEQKEFYLTDVIELAKKEKVRISPLIVDEDIFKGVNSKLDLATAENIMQDKIKRNFMNEGVIMNLPNSIFIGINVKISGETILENNTRITGNTTIINSNIKTGSVIEDSLIENSSIGPMAHIRPSSFIKDSKIGNFVEVKKSTLNSVKAGHLSYLGDAEINSGTNIGANTIICNYDGVNKFKTKIGKNVFIGSGSQLISPLNIGNGVIIAAGSVIPKGNIEENTIILNKIEILKKNYKKKEEN